MLINELFCRPKACTWSSQSQKFGLAAKSRKRPSYRSHLKSPKTEIFRKFSKFLKTTAVSPIPEASGPQNLRTWPFPEPWGVVLPPKIKFQKFWKFSKFWKIFKIRRFCSETENFQNFLKILSKIFLKIFRKILPCLAAKNRPQVHHLAHLVSPLALLERQAPKRGRFKYRPLLGRRNFRKFSIFHFWNSGKISWNFLFWENFSNFEKFSQV